MAGSKVKALVVATRCSTIEQFVATFHRFSDDQSFFVATLNARPIGLESAFSIQLADRTPVLRGTCIVLAAWSTPDNQYKRPGVQLGIKRMTPDSELVFEQLRHARRSATPEQMAEPAEALSETPVPMAIPPVPGAKPPPTPRTTTQRRVTSPQQTITVPPKSPPEVTVLEVIMPAAPLPNAQLEERTPGSDLILPANPLMNLTDESLQGFVDCTLYEETANFSLSDSQIDDGSEIGEAAPPPVAKPAPAAFTLIDDEPIFRPSSVMPAVKATTPIPRLAPEPVRKFLADEAMHTPMPAGEAFAPRRDLEPTRRAQTTPRRWMIIGGTAAASLVLIGVIATRSSASEGESAPPEPAQAVQPREPVARTTAIAIKPTTSKATDSKATDSKATASKTASKATALTASATSPDPVETEGSPVVGEGPCKVDVKTTPAGSMIALDGRALGPSPIVIAGSCDRHKIDLSHPRYKTEQRFVTMAAGAETNLDVTLVRPTHNLRVTTSPPGATVFIGGRPAGTSPTMVQLMGFSSIDVRVERVGFASVSTRVYSKVPEDRLSISLNPQRRPPPK